MSDFVISHPAEQSLACRALVLGARNASDSMEKFVHWLLAGFAAGLVYLLAHPTIPSASLRAAGVLYLIAAAFGIVQRYLSMIVTTAATVFQEAEKLHDKNTRVDVARFFIIYINALPTATRWGAAWSASRFMKGNLIATGKGLMNLTLLQCLFGLICAGLLLAAFCVVIRAI